MSLTCPICSSHLARKKTWEHVMDPNSCFVCEGPDKHEFWSHPFSWRIYHYTTVGASATNYQFERRWELIEEGSNHSWKELPKEDPKPEPKPVPAISDKKRITFTIDATGFDTEEFRQLIYKAETRSRKQNTSVAHILAEALNLFFNATDD